MVGKCNKSVMENSCPFVIANEKGMGGGEVAELILNLTSFTSYY